ncbi:MAG: formyl transferase [Candidatus Ancaeobacter aquaticus]|nr:formyl transferase [Candidatus Ancaeobacter aquaticus]
MNVILFTRTDRPSGARVAAQILKSNHSLIAIIAEKRTSMLTKKKNVYSVIIDSFHKYGSLFVLQKIVEYIKIKLHRYIRILCLCNKTAPYYSIQELIYDKKIPFYIVKDHNSDKTADIIKKYMPDIIVLSNTRIIKNNIIELPRYGCINLHLGKLPKYRGTDSCFWEIFNGENKGGITVHAIDASLDTGDIIIEQYIDIKHNDNELSLYKRKLQIGPQLVVKALDCIEHKSCTFIKQNPEKAHTYKWPTIHERNLLKKQQKEKRPG